MRIAQRFNARFNAGKEVRWYQVPKLFSVLQILFP